MPIGTIQRYDVTKQSRKGGITISPAINGESEIILDSPLSLSSYGIYTITTSRNVEIVVKMWGAGGGNAGSSNLGGAGGYSEGVISLNPGTTYKLIIGQAGKPPSGNLIRSSSSGGGGSAFLLVDGSTDIPLIVAGGGGGVSGAYSSSRGGAGGGLSGENALPLGTGGYGGTQTGPGAGGSGSRRTGFPGEGINGGRGSGRDAITPLGGLGYGQGGAGTIDGGDSGAGGGGGGYFGGGGGGGDGGAYPGGGGSGYINDNYVVSGVTEKGTQDVPPRSTDTERGSSGNSATDGKIIISLA